MNKFVHMTIMQGLLLVPEDPLHRDRQLRICLLGGSAVPAMRLDLETVQLPLSVAALMPMMLD